MRLIDGVKYRIEGNFCKYPPIPVFFQGQVIADRLGNLSGVMVDQYGPSTFKGHLIANIQNDRLSFSKEYDSNQPLYRGGSLIPIEHELFFGHSGGWTGTWRIASGDETDKGHVTLAIIPWEDSFPIGPDLRDWLIISGE